MKKINNINTLIKYKCGHCEKLLNLNKYNIDLILFLYWINKTGFNGSKKECFSCFLNKSLRFNYIPKLLNSEQIKNGFKINHNIKLVKIGNYGEEINNWKENNSRFRIFLKEKCEICNKNKNLTIHHIIKREVGGLDIWWNCQTLCRDCHNKLEIEILKK